MAGEWWCSVGGAAITAVCLLPLAAGVWVSMRGGMGEYTRWFGEARGWQMLFDSVFFAAGGAAFAVALSLGIVTIALRLGRGASVMVLIVSAAVLLTPSSLYASAWIMALRRAGVAATFVRERLGVSCPTVYDRPVAACLTGLRYLAPCAAMVMSAMAGAGRDAQVARVFSVRGDVRWRHVVLPRLAPSIAMGFLIVFVLVLNDPILPGMFLVQTYSGRILVRFNAMLDPAGAAALATPVAAIAAIVALLAFRVARGERGMAASQGLARPVIRGWRAVVPWTVVIGVAGVLVGVPLAALAARAGSVRALWEAMIEARAELVRTAWMTGTGGAACAVVGWILAERWRAARAAGAMALAPVTLVNLLAPPALMGIGILTLFAHRPLSVWRESDVPLMLGYVARWAPVAMLMLIAEDHVAIRQASLTARAHRVRAWDRFVWLALPMRWPGVAMAVIACALLIAIELELSVLLTQPGRSTLGVRLYTMIHTAPESLVSALALDVAFLSAGMLAVLAGVALMWHRRRGRP